MRRAVIFGVLLAFFCQGFAGGQVWASKRRKKRKKRLQKEEKFFLHQQEKEDKELLYQGKGQKAATNSLRAPIVVAVLGGAGLGLSLLGVLATIEIQMPSININIAGGRGGGGGSVTICKGACATLAWVGVGTSTVLLAVGLTMMGIVLDKRQRLSKKQQEKLRRSVEELEFDRELQNIKKPAQKPRRSKPARKKKKLQKKPTKSSQKTQSKARQKQEFERLHKTLQNNDK